MFYTVSTKHLLHSIFSDISESFRRLRIFAFSAFFSAETFIQAHSRESADEKAVRYLDDYGESILRMAYSYLHNYADAEEIVQDTIIKVIGSGAVFENASHEKSYILSAAANLSKNRIKFNKIRETDELSEDLAAEEREDLMFVWDKVKELPPKYSEVIHLFYYEGYKTAEIASVLGRNEVTVRSDLSRARKLLRDSLKEAYDFG